MALSLQRYTWSDSSSGLNRFLKDRVQQEGQNSLLIAVKLDVLPETLIVEILSWLPVKALLQFKTVCKSWYAIITSSDFISKHIQHYYKNSIDNDCLLTHYYVSHAELQLFEMLVDETPRVVAHEVLYEMPMYGSYICGPCDGMYYVYNYDSSDRAIWNPTINELKMLPPIVEKPDLPSNLTYAKHEAYGFGYEPSTRDYRVVVIKGYWADDDITHPLSVLIYSSGTNSWRYWGDLAQNYDLESNKCYIFVNGCFYWLGLCEQYENSELIICFDLVADASHEIQVPNYEQPASKSLGMYHNSLAFLCVHEMEKRFDIWTLNDGLWSKKFSMGPIPELRRPIGHWKNNKIVLEYEDGQLVLCDTDRQEISDLAYKGDHWCEGVFAYKESLVSIKG